MMMKMRVLKLVMVMALVVSFSCGSVLAMAGEPTMEITMTEDYDMGTIEVSFAYDGDESHYFEVTFTGSETTTLTTYKNQVLFLMESGVTSYSADVKVFDSQGAEVVLSTEATESIAIDQTKLAAKEAAAKEAATAVAEAEVEVDVLDDEIPEAGMTDIEDEALPQTGGIPMLAMMAFGFMTSGIGFAVKNRK